MISCDWKEALEPVDYVRSGALFVAFLATAFGSAETWIQTDTIAMTVVGSAWLLFPTQLLSMQTDVKLDFMHTVLGQTIGAFCLALATFNYLNRKSRDTNVWLGVFMSRVVGGFALLISQIMTLTSSRDKKGWTLQYVTFTVLGSTLFLIANMVQIWKSSTYSTSSAKRGVADHLSKHISLCAVLEIVAVFQAYSHMEELTKHFFEKSPVFDVVHHDLGKEVACLMLTSALLTLAALNFEDNNARKNLMLVKTVLILGVMVLDIGLQVRYKVYKKDMFIWEVVQYIPYLAVTGLGYFHTEKHMIDNKPSNYRGKIPPCMALMLSIFDAKQH